MADDTTTAPVETTEAEAPPVVDPPTEPTDLKPVDQQSPPSQTVEDNLVDLTQDPPTAADSSTSELFDPSASNIGDVQAALDAADGAEFARIKAAEREGKGRKGVLGYTQNPANVEPDADGYTRVIIDA